MNGGIPSHTLCISAMTSGGMKPHSSNSSSHFDLQIDSASESHSVVLMHCTCFAPAAT
jgi:hypothetical protein